MTQSKPVKKKKKSKTPKGQFRNDEIPPPPPTPVDKKKLADEAVRQMFKEAFQIYENHKRSLRAKSARDAAGKLKAMAKSSRRSAYIERYLITDLTNRKAKSVQEGLENNMSLLKLKMLRRRSELMAEEMQTGVRTSTESTRIPAGSHGGISQRSSSILPGKRSIEMRDSEEFQSANEDAIQVKKSKTNNRSDYKIGPFVSLEVLDRMTCDSDTPSGSRKGMRRERRKSQKRGECSDQRIEGYAKKSYRGGRRKGEVNIREQKSLVQNVRDVKRYGSKTESVTRGLNAENLESDVNKKLFGHSKLDRRGSHSSTADNKPAATVPGGDLFKSKISHSHFATDTYISKIDKKFIEILEAITQTKIGLDKKSKDVGKLSASPGINPSTSKIKTGEEKRQGSSRIEQKLLDRISYLEEVLEKSKRNDINNSSECENVGDVTSKAEVEKLTEVERNNVPAASTSTADEKQIEVDTPSKMTGEGTIAPEAGQYLKPHRKIPEPDMKQSDLFEKLKSQESFSKGAKRRSDELRWDRKEPGLDGKGAGCKQMKTWSIISRLEKAFQTLGLNVKDSEHSDQEEEIVAKKKHRGTRRESSGQERRAFPVGETARRWSDFGRGSTTRASPADDITHLLETNGSGDKNMEYRRVRSSKKMEHLASLTKGRRSLLDNQRDTYYASLRVKPRFTMSEYCELNGLPDGKHIGNVKKKTSKKTISDDEKMAELGIMPKMSKLSVDDIPRYGKRPPKTIVDDCRLGRGKSKSECSLSMSCSKGSLSEEDTTRNYKRKKNQSLDRDLCREFWPKSNGKGQTMSLTVMSRKANRESQPEVNYSCDNFRSRKTKDIIEMGGNDEADLKQIRRRHKQIISDIKVSLEEIKKQHNLCTRLRKQTKQFNRDCHAKWRLLASYLKDVETNSERRQERYPNWDLLTGYSRHLSSDDFNRCLMKKSKMRGRISDCDVGAVRCKTRRRDQFERESCEADDICISTNETENDVSEIPSSILFGYTTTDVGISEEESYHSLASSLHSKFNVLRRSPPGKWVANKEVLKQQCRGDKRGDFPDDNVKHTSSYIVELLQKLHTIIVTEKNQLEDLVMKASTTSGRSTQSNKTRSSLPEKSSGSSFHREMHHKTSNAAKPMMTENEIVQSPAQRDSKENTKKPRSDNLDEELVPRMESREETRSFDTLPDRDQEGDSSEPTHKNRNDPFQKCGTSCMLLEKHAEEHRYRKGDPSFRSQAFVLQHLGEHTRHCAENHDDSWKRKLELERILRGNEKIFKSASATGKDGESLGRSLDFHARGRTRTRQQSMIIDHNRGDEYEESQIVLGHASRHNGGEVGYRRQSRKIPEEYLKANRLSESKHMGRLRDYWKKGKRYHMEELPINYLESSGNIPGCSDQFKDMHCQTDIIDEFDEAGECYILEESESSVSLN